jgi:SpoVK/Ycf46/Vps4 family AAA+-type ATPase
LSPCLLFIDEVDALVTKREDWEITANSNTGDDGVHARVLSQLLNEMDGIQEKHQVFLIACTSRIDRIDSAILRPGRFDQLIEVPLPSIEDRKELIRRFSQRTPLSSSVDSNELAELTENFSGAAIDMLFREAALLALHEDFHATVINKEHLQKAFEVVVFDPTGPSALPWQAGD